MNQEGIQKYIAGNATKEEKDAVVNWLSESEENEREFLALHRLNDIAIWDSNVVKNTENVEKPMKPKNKAFFYLRAVAAAIILIVVTTLYVKYTAKIEPQMQTLFVPSGQRAELMLADGTKVWLNAGTTFTFPTHFGDQHREVTLDGEAYFDVKKDADRMFTVKTVDHDVNVFGTEFNVFAYSRSQETFEVSLVKGSVEVTSDKKHERIRLEPNTKAFYNQGILMKGDISDFDNLLWREGIIFFENESVKDLVNKLELYYDIEIEIQNQALLNRRYSGKFRVKDGIEHIFKVLKLQNNFIYEKIDDQNLILIK